MGATLLIANAYKKTIIQHEQYNLDFQKRKEKKLQIDTYIH